LVFIVVFVVVVVGVTTFFLACREKTGVNIKPTNRGGGVVTRHTCIHGQLNVRKM